MFRSIEDLVSSSRVTVNCGRSTTANGGALGGREGWHVASSISKVMTTADSGIPLETICRPTQFQLPIFHIILGVGA